LIGLDIDTISSGGIERGTTSGYSGALVFTPRGFALMKSLIGISLAAGCFVCVVSTPALANYLQQEEMAQAKAAKHAAEIQSVEMKKQAEFAAIEQKHALERAELIHAEQAKMLSKEAQMHQLQQAEAIQAAEKAKGAQHINAAELRMVEGHEASKEAMEQKAVEKAREWAEHHKH
jgi:hypothetical protein